MNLQTQVFLGYVWPMDSETKKILAREGSSDPQDVAVRFKAARLVSGLSQEQLAEAVGRGGSNISNVEAGRTRPSWGMMLLLYHEHRIDINFVVVGAWSQLPGDVQEAIFQHLQPEAA